MKLKDLLSGHSKLRAVLCATVALFSVGNLHAADFFTGSVSGIDLGNAGRTYLWSIFSLSDGVTIHDITDGDAPHGSSFYDTIGNVAIAGTGNLNFGGTGNPSIAASRIKGSLYLRTGGTATYSGGAGITGSTFQNAATNTILNTGVSNANSAAAAAAALAVTPALAAITNINLSNTTYSIPAATAANTTYVLKLTNLMLSHATLMLNGGGFTNVNYVINIRDYLKLSAASKIVLTGGLKPQNVLFNVGTTKTYGVSLGGDSILNGIILAPNRVVELGDESIVNGEVIAKRVSLSDHSQVRNPLVSP